MLLPQYRLLSLFFFAQAVTSSFCPLCAGGVCTVMDEPCGKGWKRVWP